MVVTIEPLFDKEQTCKTIYDISRRYAMDLDLCYKGRTALSDLKPYEFYGVVRDIQYVQDVPGTEIIMRPIHVLRLMKGDCKKKTTLLSSYALLRGIPFRYACTSKRPDQRIHHIFPQFKIDGQYTNYDATYPWYKIGDKKLVTNLEYFLPGTV